MTQQQQKEFINFVVFHVTRNVSERFSYHKISMATEEYFTTDGKFVFCIFNSNENQDIKEC